MTILEGESLLNDASALLIYRLAVVSVAAGTSGGVGMGTSVRGSQLWLVAGDEITATIEKIGTLRHKVEAAPPPPPGTGSYLPPVATCRKPPQ